MAGFGRHDEVCGTQWFRTKTPSVSTPSTIHNPLTMGSSFAQMCEPGIGNGRSVLHEVLSFLRRSLLQRLDQRSTCGSNNKDGKACRPLVRKGKDTPITIKELLKIHSKKKLLSLARKKEKRMKGRLFWERGVFYE